jgi:hypothetical protein
MTKRMNTHNKKEEIVNTARLHITCMTRKKRISSCCQEELNLGLEALPNAAGSLLHPQPS